MAKRNRVAMTISLSPDVAREYEAIAKAKGETKSQLFREMFSLYRQQRLEEELSRLQKYGTKKLKEKRFTEKDIERLVFDNR